MLTGSIRSWQPQLPVSSVIPSRQCFLLWENALPQRKDLCFLHSFLRTRTLHCTLHSCLLSLWISVSSFLCGIHWSGPYFSLKVMIHLSAVSEVALNLAPEILTNVMALGGGWLLINSPVQMPWDTPLPAGWIPSWYAPPGCERMRGTLAAAGKELTTEALRSWALWTKKAGL